MISWCVVHHWVQRTKEFKRWLFWFVEEMYFTVPQGKYKMNSQNACSTTLFMKFSQVVQLDMLRPGWLSLTWAYLNFIYLDYDTEKPVEIKSYPSLPAAKSDAKNAIAHVLFSLFVFSLRPYSDNICKPGTGQPVNQSLFLKCLLMVQREFSPQFSESLSLVITQLNMTVK